MSGGPRQGPRAATRKIVLTTIGTLGDLHPFIAIGLALEKRGFAPVLAVPEDQVGKCRQAGLQAIAILPGFEAIRRRMGLSHEQAVKRIIGNQRVMLEQVLLPGLSDCAAALDAIAADAEAIVASIFVFAAPMITEKRDLALVSVILQPMAMLSAIDPPCTPDFWMLKRPPVGRFGHAWNRAVYAAIRQILQRLYGRRIDRVRAEQGLPPSGARHLFEPPARSALRLGCYSPQLGALPPDVAPSTQIVGFPMFDSHSGKAEALDPVLSDFLAAGPAPLVFTLGTFAVSSAGSFYDIAAQSAQRLGMRAVLLTGGNAAPSVEGDILRCGYAPHSLLFERAAVIIHHGGVGTTGQAMRAGKPQLVVPHMGDQYDHAHRIERLGAGLRLKNSRFTLERVTARIATLLGQPVYGAAAARIAAAMAGEQGADAAADAIAQALSASSPDCQAAIGC